MKMKTLQSIKILLAFALLSGVLFTSCLEDSCSEERHFIQMEPLYAFPDDFRIDAVTEAPREMEETGKMYFYNNYIFVNEKYEGVHVIDNRDPKNPQNAHFISIPGNLDISIKNDLLYADSYVDLLTIDISDITNPRILCRDEEVFESNGFDEQRGYLVEWVPTENVITIDCSDPNFGSNRFQRSGGIFVLEDAQVVVPNSEVDNDGAGQAGSQNRFTVIKDFLYVLNQTELIAYDLEDPTKPRLTQSTFVNWAIETIFPYEDYIFIGSQTGMFIYEIANDPSSPQFVSSFDHAQACDPVFVKNDIAYVTLREGTFCNNAVNQLDVIDVSNIERPRLIRSYDMDNPHGLSVVDDVLYLCEGESGLKVFDVENLEEIDQNRLSHKKGFDAYDAISLSAEHLLIVGKDGLVQFDSSNPKNLEEMSFITVK